MPANVISGIGGAVSGHECVNLWKLARISEPAVAVCSASNGSVIRIPGLEDWQGVFTGYGHTPAVLPGDLFQFIGATSEGKGASSVANGAIAEQVDINWDIEGGKIIDYAVYFACATGVITFGAASASDTSVPNPSSARSCTLNLTGCEELRKMKLTLMSKNPSYVTATTAGQRERVAGIKDAKFEAKIYTDDASFPTIAQVTGLEFGVGGGLSWAMTSAIITLTAPMLPLGGGLFEADIAGEFTGYSGGVEGTITTPAGAAWWP